MLHERAGVEAGLVVTGRAHGVTTFALAPSLSSSTVAGKQIADSGFKDQLSPMRASKGSAPDTGILSRPMLAGALVASLGTRSQARARKHGKCHKSRMSLAATKAAAPVALTGDTLQASLKMRCDTTGASYAIYWANVNGKLVVAGDYVTDERKASLKEKGFDRSFAEESEDFALEATGSAPLAVVYQSREPLFIEDVSQANLKRKELANKYGITQMCIVPFEAGVLEFGHSDDMPNWDTRPDPPVMPKAEMRQGFENLGASYAMFWIKDGDTFKVVADYVTEARREALRLARGDNETFCSKSRAFTLDANGDGPVSTAFKTGKEVILRDLSKMKRAALAEEFGIAAFHFVPSKTGVLEYGIPKSAGLSGDTLGASLKMRCDTSGASYALYWRETDGKMVVAGVYTTAARQQALADMGKSIGFADASKEYVLDASGDGPVGTALKTQQPFYIQDATACTTMKRSALTKEYGIKSICFVPVEGGVMEYGTTEKGCSTNWTCVEDACKAVMPKAELKRAFDGGATHAIFWWKQGDYWVVGAYYVTPERVRALKAARGDDKSYAGESQKRNIPIGSMGPVATAGRSGKTIVLDSPAEVSSFRRADLAREFGIARCHFAPCKDGVLEYGVGRSR
eukprot:TRINITY_DN7325_c0_g2_i1.p1 TRINITY_DN7325_c0_g2~~TRINITY_DN7325_c0_g2_i1.p1  ORF type:complete len:630 (-),score=126.82 TRINITY_DN7325_c0_g2_i1:42-1931(-)